MHSLNVGVKRRLIVTVWCLWWDRLASLCCGDDLFFFPRDKMWRLIITAILYQGLVNSAVLEGRKKGVDPEAAMNIVSCYCYHFSFRRFQ